MSLRKQFGVGDWPIKTVAVNGPLKGMQVRARGNQFKVAMQSCHARMSNRPSTYDLWQMLEEQIDAEILPHVRGLIRETAFRSETSRGTLYFFWMDNLQ